MKFLIIGDIYGKIGKQTIKQFLPIYKRRYKPDLIIANGENVSKGGKSLIHSDYVELMSYGINYFTMGNHTFRNPKINEYIDNVNNIIRPANLKGDFSGKGYITFEINNKKILLINLLGISFINLQVHNFFNTIDKILEMETYDFAILDFHAETTSEKIVFANYLSDKINVFVGTHTHIQTSDERIMIGKNGNKLAYITDVGMTGVFHSAIGADFEAVTNRMRQVNLNKDNRFIEAVDNEVVFNAILVTTDKNMQVIKVKRISELHTLK